MTTIKQNKTSKLKKMTNLSKSSENVLDILEVSNKTNEINSILQKLELDANILTIISFINNLVKESNIPFDKLDESATEYDIIEYINELRRISIITNAAEDLSPDATLEDIINYLNKCNIDSGEIDAIKSKFGDILYNTSMYDADAIDSLIRKIYVEIKNLEANIPTLEKDPIINDWLSSTNNIQIGNNSKALAGNKKNNYSVTLGKDSETNSKSRNNYGVAIGYGASAEITNSQNDNNTIAIGHNAKVNQNNSIQLGSGTNNTSGTLQFREYPLVDSNGKIFEKRIPEKIFSDISALSSETDYIENQVIDLSNDFISENAWRSKPTIIIGKDIDPKFLSSNYNSIMIGNKAAAPAGETIAIGSSAKATGYCTIAIGKDANKDIDNKTPENAIAIGHSSRAKNNGAIAIGNIAQTGTSNSNNAIAIGTSTISRGDGSIVIGKDSEIKTTSNNSITIGVSAMISGNNVSDAIQLGTGTNTTNKSLQFREYLLINENGNIPIERIPEISTLSTRINELENFTTYLGVFDSLSAATQKVDKNKDGQIAIIGQSEYIYGKISSLNGEDIVRGWTKLGDTTAEMTIITELSNAVAEISSDMSYFATKEELNSLDQAKANIESVEELKNTKADKETVEGISNTLATFGDIVTHNASEFEKAGAADAALLSAKNYTDDQISALSADVHFRINEEVRVINRDISSAVTDLGGRISSSYNQLDNKYTTAINDVNSNITSLSDQMSNFESNITEITDTIYNLSTTLSIEEEDPVFIDWKDGESIALGSGSLTPEHATQSITIGYKSTSSGERNITVGPEAYGYSGNDTITIGTSASANGDKSIVIGHNAGANTSDEPPAPDSIAIGSSAQARVTGSIAIGASADASGQNTTAIGTDAKITENASNGSIQLGTGTLSDANILLKVGNYPLLDLSGTIYKERIDVTPTMNYFIAENSDTSSIVISDVNINQSINITNESITNLEIVLPSNTVRDGNTIKIFIRKINTNNISCQLKTNNSNVNIIYESNQTLPYVISHPFTIINATFFYTNWLVEVPKTFEY